jgi:hypothetical protein
MKKIKEFFFYVLYILVAALVAYGLLLMFKETVRLLLGG